MRQLSIHPMIIIGVLSTLAITGSVVADAEFTVPAYGFWSGPGQMDYYVEGIDEGVYVKWSFSSDQPLDFQIINPRGNEIDSYKSQTLTSGKFKAQDTGTYHFFFQNYYEEEAHVSMSVQEDVATETAYDLFYIAIIGIIIVVVVVTVYYIWAWQYDKKRKAVQQVSQQPIQQHRQPTTQPQQPIQSQYQPRPQPQQRPIQTPPPQHAPQQQPLSPVEPVIMKTCPTCGHQNMSDARFCNTCGKSVN